MQIDIKSDRRLNVRMQPTRPQDARRRAVDSASPDRQYRSWRQSGTRFFLDSNVYDLLNADVPTRELATRLAETNRIEFVASPILLLELKASPFKGLPDWFPVRVLPEGVGIAGVARAGMARSSAGIVFKQHLGESRKGADAIIAHSAHSMRAVLVSEDHRCRERLKVLAGEANARNYEQFRAFLASQPECNWRADR